ncbi:MAG: ABC transporter permease [Thaumarchaeota archaeon]|nr:ABC transporter permease [Nitrososphaerota archaeon]
MARYVLRRLIFMIPVFLAVSSITYLIGNASGDPIVILKIGNPRVTPETLEVIRAYYDLDKPVYVRYFLWLGKFFQGDLGRSFAGGSVNEVIGAWTWTTLKLQVTAIVLSVLIGIPIGVFSARRQYSKADIGITTAAIFGVSMPTFWFGLVLIIVFSSNLQWLPSAGAKGLTYYWWGDPFLDEIAHMILPTIVLTYVSLALIVRLVRANMLEVIRQDFVLAAKASGLPDRITIYKHALKNAISPVMTYIGISFGLALGGAPLTETVFSWPGLGFKFVEAALELNLPVVQGITVIIAVMVMFANLITDLAYGVLDPRVRIE